jgi:dihydropteroate synthase
MEPTHFRAWLVSPPPARRPLVMGVLNVTPDSFSDGGKIAGVDAAVAAAADMVESGADLIDIGGESTRPGSQPIETDEQVRRVVPVVRAIRQAGLCVTLSIDTTRATVAAAALDAGADMVNDISAGRDDPALLPLVADCGVPVVLMHMQGRPATMQLNPTYSDVTAEVIAFLKERVEFARNARVAPGSVLLDPGIGFGKALEHNLQLLRDTSRIASALAPHPLLIGSSRKGFIGKIIGECHPAHRQFGTAATVAWGVANGVGVVRVHDVREMVQVVRMVRAITVGEPNIDQE